MHRTLPYGNLAFANDVPSVPLINRAVIRNESTCIIPNPVVSSQVYVSFNVKETGRYTIQLLDLTGKILSEKIAVIDNGAPGGSG